VVFWPINAFLDDSLFPIPRENTVQSAMIKIAKKSLAFKKKFILYYACFKHYKLVFVILLILNFQPKTRNNCNNVILVQNNNNEHLKFQSRFQDKKDIKCKPIKIIPSKKS
jgi:hypothetical protein